MTYTRTGYDRGGSLIDSEYEALEGMTKGDLWDYLSSQGLEEYGLIREESDKLHDEFGLLPGE